MELEFWIGVEMSEGLLEMTMLFDSEDEAKQWCRRAGVGYTRQMRFVKYELDDDEVSDFAKNALDMRYVDDTEPWGH